MSTLLPIKTILLFTRNLGYELARSVLSVARTTILQINHPTCRFYPGAFVDKSSVLGRSNVVFKNTIVVNTTIGDHSLIQKNSRVFNADIGKFTSISSRVSIGLGRHPTEMVSTHAAFYSNTQPVAKSFCDTDDFLPCKRITIGNDVTIYENVMIMDGVIIGDGAVVAMGSVVTSNVLPYAIVAGNPARFFMWRFNEEIKEKLLASRWWDQPDEWMRAHYRVFADPRAFIALFEKSEQDKSK